MKYLLDLITWIMNGLNPEFEWFEWLPNGWIMCLKDEFFYRKFKLFCIILEMICKQFDWPSRCYNECMYWCLERAYITTVSILIQYRYIYIYIWNHMNIHKYNRARPLLGLLRHCRVCSICGKQKRPQFHFQFNERVTNFCITIKANNSHPSRART